ncbi:MAG: ThuA domain-containing protein [Planctomycetota bacterium]|jgi:type 1 glutamine amidotransferase/nicotinamidase-related amidase
MKRDKRQTCNVIPLTIGVLLVVMLLHGLAAGKITVKAGKNQDKIVVNARSLVKVSEEGSEFRVVNNRQQWKPSETAIIICDMWNEHWCKGATRRVAELAPRINRFIMKARRRGVLIVHAPSATVKHYENHPARKRAQTAPQAANLPPDIGGWCRWIDANEKTVYPIDQSDGGCDCDPKCKGGKPWRKQIETIRISDIDAISDSGEEIWNLFEERGINNVIILGVHTNMCVLGRPFGLRNMARHGKNVVLVRDLTDTMYNHRMRPYVSHFTGTSLIVEHIEKHVCPTITSTVFTGKPAFCFKNDKRPRVVFVIAENEYDADKTLPEFARELENKYGFACEFALGVPKTSTAKERNDIAGLEAMHTADLAVVYVRRRALPAEQMRLLKNYVNSGKPLIGLRTASHAFAPRGERSPGIEDWPEFDRNVLGGNYHGHHGNKTKDGPRTHVWIKPSTESHPVLAGVPTGEFYVRSWLYKTSPLTKTTTALMMGRVEDRKPHEPVAWTNKHIGGGRVFYTSLGHPDDFKLHAFRRMLINAAFWALNKPVPKLPADGIRPATKR